jgi:hypothetical protein
MLRSARQRTLHPIYLSRRRNSPSVRRQIKSHKPWVRIMSKFDSIASPTVRAADNLEPSFVHEDQIRVAKHKLSDRLARRKKRPNVLIYTTWAGVTSAAMGEASPSAHRRRTSTSLHAEGSSSPPAIPNPVVLLRARRYRQVASRTATACIDLQCTASQAGCRAK